MNQLRSLNLSENNLQQIKPRGMEEDFEAEDNVIGILSEFVHLNSLLHLDLGNIKFSFG